jgi:regulator of replication initiation timing
MSDKAKVEVLSEQITVIGNSYHELKKELAALESENAKLKRELKQLQRSLSWQLTKPLRAVSRLLKR